MQPLSRRTLLRLAAANLALAAMSRAAAAQAETQNDALVLPFALTTPVRCGEVALRVRDLAMMTDWYQRALGLSVIAQDGDTAVLGAGGVPLVHLLGRSGAAFESGIQAGLYHTAFLMPDREALARWLVHAAYAELPVTGVADHSVSEAIYLNDPEGNGIEVYADRDPAGWQWNAGRVTMGSHPLDVEGLASLVDVTRSTFVAAPDGLRIGHMHLRVGDVEQGKAFYQTAVGLDLTSQRDGSAAFLASGGYHHHVAVNSWNSFGATLRNPGSTGLDWFSLRVADVALIEAQAARLEAGGFAVTPEGAGIVATDPWGTGLRLLPA